MCDAERMDLNLLAAGLPPAQVEEIADFIGYLRAKLSRALPPVLRDAPAEDEPIGAEEAAALAEARAELASGLPSIPADQLRAELGR